MKIENFAILVRAEGVTGQVVLTAAEQRLFSRLIIGAIADVNVSAKIIPIESIELPANSKVFPQ
ncbi:hypothetical protein F4826_002978 [Rahnella inusitata]|nr:hypothetical protein [Rahnella inusitata]